MGEVIQNKETFVEKLKKLVIRENKSIVKNNPDYEQYLAQEIEKMLKVRSKFVAITTPEEEKKFIAEARRSITAAISTKEAEKTPKKDEEKSAEEKKEEIQDKKNKSKEEKSTGIRDISSKNIGYLDRYELLYQMKVNMLRDQLKKDEFVPSDKEFYKMLLLQKSIENDREDAIKGLDEKSKLEFIKVEEEFKYKELELERRSNQKFRQELEEFARLNTKTKELNEWIEQKEEEMREGLVDPEEYQKQMKQKKQELSETLEKISALNPKRLQEACETKAKHTRLEKAIMGKDYYEQVYLRSSDEMKEKLNYKNEKEKYQAAVINRESKFFDQNGINKTIELDKKHKEELEKEMDKLNEKEQTPEVVKRKAEVMKELRIVDTRLDGTENKKEELEQGLDSNSNVEAKLAQEDKAVEEDIKKIEEDFVEVDKNIENMEQDIQTAGIQGKTEEEIRKEALKTGAVVGGAVAITGGDMGDSLIAGGIAAEIKQEEEHKKQGKINEWESMVNEKPDEKAVENYRETQEALKEQEEIYEQERIRK